jgi:hypothetical protein
VPGKRSVRGVFNNKIKNFTRNPTLTQEKGYSKELEVFSFGQGQIFGEERFFYIETERRKIAAEKETLLKISRQRNVEMSDQDKERLKQLEEKDNLDRSTKAPYQIVCSSITGQLMKIPSSDFTRKIMKDVKAFESLSDNIQDKKRKTNVKI